LYNAKVEILSPLHIGDDDNKTITSLIDFVFDNNDIKLIDHKKLENIFEENPYIMEDFLKEIKAHSGQKFSLKHFLQKYKIAINEVISNESISFIGNFEAKEIHPFISENGNKFLPGSSVKGAIRNALAFIYLKEHPEMIGKIHTLYFKAKSKPNFSSFDKAIFGKNPFNDILKFLQVSDSVVFPKNSTAIYGCNTFHLKRQNETVPINYECIKPNSITNLRIKIKDKIPFDRLQIDDRNFWKNNLTIPKIFNALNFLSQKFIEREIRELSPIKEMQATIDFYQNLSGEIKEANKEAAYFCLGKGTTIMEKTVLLALSDAELRNLRNKMRNTRVDKNFGWKFINNEKKAADKFPVTRLVYKNRNVRQTGFGWLKITKI